MSTGEATATEPVDGDVLVAELNALGVHFLWGAHAVERRRPMAPARLLASLASSPDARLRLALIPLFLHRPEYAHAVCDAADGISGGARITLICYYAAATFLQQKHLARLADLGEPTMPLPDRFSAELGLATSPDPETGLSNLAQRHAYLSGDAINWLGTYKHAAGKWLGTLERERVWSS